jgi:hypothetical protein
MTMTVLMQWHGTISLDHDFSRPRRCSCGREMSPPAPDKMRHVLASQHRVCVCFCGGACCTAGKCALFDVLEPRARPEVTQNCCSLRFLCTCVMRSSKLRPIENQRKSTPDFRSRSKNCILLICRCQNRSTAARCCFPALTPVPCLARQRVRT